MRSLYSSSVPLPDPFEWIHIPAGRVRLQYPPYKLVKSHWIEVDAFSIAKYPITNAQSNVYLQETGNDLRRRKYYDQPEYHQPLQPLIDISWYDAMRFCEWLTNKAGYLITLPTDAQWQRAAQGDDDRRYPWGDEWDNDKCNSEHNTIQYTTPVTQYPQGASPFGVMDMVGNVCEWCLTNAKTGENSLQYSIPETPETDETARVFRGGYDMSSRASANVISAGAITLEWHSYSCGIRLVTNKD